MSKNTMLLLRCALASLNGYIEALMHTPEYGTEDERREGRKKVYEIMKKKLVEANELTMEMYDEQE